MEKKVAKTRGSAKIKQGPLRWAGLSSGFKEGPEIQPAKRPISIQNNLEFWGLHTPLGALIVTMVDLAVILRFEVSVNHFH